MAKPTGLGQGVNLLFGDQDKEDQFFECDVDKIVGNKHQPRRHFSKKELQKLSASIKKNGVLQPLVVNSRNSDGSYELIAGERRLRASRLAGLSTVPVIIHKIDNEDALLELALVENLQRQDLNAIEEAEAYQKLIDKFSYTQEQTAKRVGKNRSTVTNILRLLNLPQFIKDDLIQGLLTEGHARVLLRLVDDPDMIKDVRNEIIPKKLSVRQTEQLVKNLKTSKKRSEAKKVHKSEDGMPNTYASALSNQLTNKLHSKVAIRQNGKHGKIEIDYYSIDDLERLIALIVGEKR